MPSASPGSSAASASGARCAGTTRAGARCKHGALSGAAHCAQHIGRMERELADAKERRNAWFRYAHQLEDEIQASRDFVELLGDFITNHGVPAHARTGPESRALQGAQRAVRAEEKLSRQYKAKLPLWNRSGADATLEMREGARG